MSMSTMYASSVPQFKRMLQNLSEILKKAEGFAANMKIDPKVLLELRLFPDMFPLVRQVQIASDQVRNGCARIAGIELLKLEDNEQSFEELQVRLSKTIEFLDKINPVQMDGTEQKEIKYSMGNHHFDYTAHLYLMTSIIPNFYFHVTTTYNILRHCGLEIGKGDYLGKK